MLLIRPENISYARLQSYLIPGDVLLTYGSFGLYPLRRIVLNFLYKAIREHQKKEYGADSDYFPTHVRVYAGDAEFFECTAPYCKYTRIEELALKEKAQYQILRHQKYRNINVPVMRKRMNELIGTKYDKGDLVDFALSGWLGVFSENIRLFGDRVKKYKVCSTGAAYVLHSAGLEFSESLNAITPAYFSNSNLWYPVLATENK